MSLWTPDGEHPVGPTSPAGGGDQAHPAAREQTPAPPQDAAAYGDDPYGDIDPETAARVEDQMAQAQAQLLAAPVESVVSNHVMGLFELAALHLRVEDPDMEAVRLPIDAMGLLVDNLGERLAEHQTLSAALMQLRMAYVEVGKQMKTDESDPDPDGDDEHPDSATDDDTISEADFLE